MDIFQYLWNLLGVFGATIISGKRLPEDTNLSYSRADVQNYSKHQRNLWEKINDARSEVQKIQPPADRMNFLYYDEDLAEEAKKFVSDCDRDYNGHNDVISSSHPEFNDGFSVEDLVDSWTKAIYSVTTDICMSSMKLCNDFKLVTRGDSARMGCATNVCERKPGQEPEYVTACKFDQTLTSGPPYRKSHTPCTGCSADQTCFKNLCRNRTDVDEDATTATPITTTYHFVREADNDTIPILIHGKPNLGNISHHANDTDGHAEPWKWQGRGGGVSWVAFIVLCVVLAITLVLAVWALAVVLRLKSKIPVDGKNF